MVNDDYYVPQINQNWLNHNTVTAEDSKEDIGALTTVAIGAGDPRLLMGDNVERVLEPDCEPDRRCDETRDHNGVSSGHADTLAVRSAGNAIETRVTEAIVAVHSISDATSITSTRTGVVGVRDVSNLKQTEASGASTGRTLHKAVTLRIVDPRRLGHKSGPQPLSWKVIVAAQKAAGLFELDDDKLEVLKAHFSGFSITFLMERLNGSDFKRTSLFGRISRTTFNNVLATVLMIPYIRTHHAKSENL